MSNTADIVWELAYGEESKYLYDHMNNIDIYDMPESDTYKLPSTKSIFDCKTQEEIENHKKENEEIIHKLGQYDALDVYLSLGGYYPNDSDCDMDGFGIYTIREVLDEYVINDLDHLYDIRLYSKGIVITSYPESLFEEDDDTGITYYAYDEFIHHPENLVFYWVTAMNFTDANYNQIEMNVDELYNTLKI